MREELGMSKQMGNPQKGKYGYDAGFAGLEYNEEKAKKGQKLTVMSAKMMTGNELEEFLEQYGQQFPITVGFHEVAYNPDTQELSYTDTLGVKKTTSKEKAKEYRDKQARQGTLKTKSPKGQDKSDTTR